MAKLKTKQPKEKQKPQKKQLTKTEKKQPKKQQPTEKKDEEKIKKVAVEQPKKTKKQIKSQKKEMKPTKKKEEKKVKVIENEEEMKEEVLKENQSKKSKKQKVEQKKEKPNKKSTKQKVKKDEEEEEIEEKPKSKKTTKPKVVDMDSDASEEEMDSDVNEEEMESDVSEDEKMDEEVSEEEEEENAKEESEEEEEMDEEESEEEKVEETPVKETPKKRKNKRKRTENATMKSKKQKISKDAMIIIRGVKKFNDEEIAELAESLNSQSFNRVNEDTVTITLDSPNEAEKMISNGKIEFKKTSLKVEGYKEDSIYDKNVIFVSQLPRDITEQELSNLMGQIGKIEQIFFFQSDAEAAVAFKEYHEDEENPGSKIDPLDYNGALIKEKSVSIRYATVDDRKVVVANVGHKTSVETLKEYFSECGEVEDIQKGPKVIVTFKSIAGVHEALQYNGADIEGRAVRIHRKSSPEDNKKKNRGGRGRK